MSNDAVDLSTSPNLLLAGLATYDKRLLQPLLKQELLAPKLILEKRHTPLDRVHFIEEGLAAVLASSPDGHQEGFGLIGRDGMTGASVAIGLDQSPYDTVVLIGGASLSIDRQALQEVMYISRSLRNRMLRFNQAILAQVAQMALAKTHGNMKIRLACWLLMAHDRINSDDLPLTHETISAILGVRRASVTVALHELEGDRVIQSLRGWIVIRDRQGLENLTGAYYGLAETEYKHLLGKVIAKRAPKDAEEAEVAPKKAGKRAPPA